MMKEYKGYTACIEFDEEAGIYHGEVVGTQDVITFQAKTVEELEVAFQESVVDYLEFCAEIGRAPERPV